MPPGAAVVDEHFLRPCTGWTHALGSRCSGTPLEGCRVSREVRRAAAEVERARAPTHSPIATSRASTAAECEPRNCSHEHEYVCTGVWSQRVEIDLLSQGHRHFCSAHATGLRVIEPGRLGIPPGCCAHAPPTPPLIADGLGGRRLVLRGEAATTATRACATGHPGGSQRHYSAAANLATLCEDSLTGSSLPACRPLA